MKDVQLFKKTNLRSRPVIVIVILALPPPPYLDFPLDEAGHILLVLEHEQRVEEVVEQPVPVFVHLLHGSSWHSEGRQSSDGETRITGEVEEVLRIGVQLSPLAMTQLL